MAETDVQFAAFKMKTSQSLQNKTDRNNKEECLGFSEIKHTIIEWITINK